MKIFVQSSQNTDLLWLQNATNDLCLLLYFDINQEEECILQPFGYISVWIIPQLLTTILVIGKISSL